MDEKKILITYFSCSGKTKDVANKIADELNTDILEIKPKIPYTRKDLDWKNKFSRSSVEMQDIASRPEILNTDLDINRYDNIFIGFPIWWGICPRIIFTFIESFNFKGKNIIPFATSGGSKIDYVYNYLLENLSKDINIKEAKMFGKNFDYEVFSKWIGRLDL